MCVAEPGLFQLIPHAAGVGEPRLVHLQGQVVAECRFGGVGEIIRRLAEHPAPDGQQLIYTVGGEIEVVRDP